MKGVIIMIEDFIVWTEQEQTRARKIMLFSVVFTFLFISIVVIALVAFRMDISEYVSFYGILAGLAGSAIGFYTGTNASSDIASVKMSDTTPDLSKDQNV
jgi:glucan phosphoethanolaminetransferase (alkaline phosphatase superfamily)